MTRERALAILEATIDAAQVSLIQERLRDAGEHVMIEEHEDMPDEFYKDFERTIKELIRSNLS